jgi:hypothetical protein
LLKNSFHVFSRTKFARKLLNLRLPEALKFTEITGLVPFSTATPVHANQCGRQRDVVGRVFVQNSIR